MKVDKSTGYIIIGAILIIIAITFLYEKQDVANVSGAIPLGVGQEEIIKKIMENFKIEDKKVGIGAEAVAGKVVSVHYIGTLLDGTKFDSSYDRGEPIKFTLGAGQVIPGWEQGIIGMKVGGERTLTIPPELAYGDRAIGPIPANSTLKFEVKLEGIE